MSLLTGEMPEHMSDGYDLEPADYFANPEPGIIPELKDDNELLISMEAQIKELCDIAKDIEDSRGMSQRFALEALRVLPDVLSAPVAYYSKNPSATRYKVSLEEVHKGIWALVAAAAALVIAAVYKIIKWFTGDSSNDKPSVAQAVQASGKKIEEAGKIEEGGQAMASTMKEASRAVSQHRIKFVDGAGKDVEFKSMDDLIEKLFIAKSYDEPKKLFLQPDPGVRDLVEHGPWSELMHNVADMKILMDSKVLIRDRLKLLERIINVEKANQATGEINIGIQRDLTTLMTPIEVTVKGKPMSLGELARSMTNTRMEVNEKNSKNDTVMHYDDFFDRMDHVFHNNTMLNLLHQVHDYLPVLTDMRQELDRLEATTGLISEENQPGSNSRQFGAGIRAAIVDIGRQIAAFAAFSAECDQYMSTMKFFLRGSFGFAQEIIKRVSHALRMAGVPKSEIPEEWVAVETQMREALAEIQTKAFGTAVTRNLIAKLSQ